MKRTLLFIACVLASVTMQAQGNSNGYRPLVEEGKHWTYDSFMPLRPAKYDHYYYYDLKGDTLIAGKKCLKMYSENRNNDSNVRYEGALYEDNKKVYCFFPKKEESVLLYDFDCEVGDTLQSFNPNFNFQLLVKDIQTEDNGGNAVKKYTLQIIWGYGEEAYVSWIEGVGAMKDFFGMIPTEGNYNSLNACELNGETLYQWIEPDPTEKGYHKMGIEGKRWNYIHYYLDEDGEHRDPYSYVVKGDTIIRRTTYKKLWYQDEKTDSLVCLLLEQGRTVYKSVDLDDNSYDSPILKSFFFFDRNDFGRVFTWKAEMNPGNTNWMVYGVDTIEVKGQPFRRYTCLQKYSEEGEALTTIEYDGEGVWHDIWVEGVGSSTSGIEDQIPSHEPPVRTPGEYTYFVSCYEDGKCIFTADDFNVQASTASDVNIAYRPFLKEGKTWNYREYYHNTWNDNNWTKEISYVINGTTEIDGKTYYKMYRVTEEGSEYNCALREEDRKVWQYTYYYNNGRYNYGERLLYDFGISVGDSFTPTNYPYSFQLTSIKPKWFHHDQLLNVLFYDIMLKQDDFTELVSLVPVPIVEGVGCLDGWNIMELFRDYPTNGIVRGELFLSCYEEGKCIFTADDFNNLTADDDIAYRPFVEEGKVWKVGALNSGNPVQVVKYYFFEGDTIINGKACKQMMCQRYVNHDFAESNSISQDNSLSYVGAWYEENQKVYFCDATNNQFKLMYDFSLDANATFEVDNLSYVIGPRQTGGIEGFKGVHRDVRECGEEENTYRCAPWLEGVGGVYAPPTTNVFNVELADPMWFLMSCTVGDEVIYLNDSYEDGATPEVMESRRQRFDFTHTVKTKPRAPASPLARPLDACKARTPLQGARGTGTEESQLYGDYNNVLLDINLNPLYDAYLVCITDETGKAVYEKTINAASIVALNIDISDYAEGRYTVTVENSNEAFTGEIELEKHLSGISIIPALFQEERAIYNLHGQRISSLQKGLNIVNGQKVFVK